MIARSSSALDWLESNGGTPSLAAAPNHFKKGDQPSCRVNWSDYHSRTIPPAPRFLITGYKLTHITGADGLNNLRTAIARGSPIAFGTSLYADFKHYRGGPSPYVGNGQLLHESSGKKAGHAMLIAAYDDNRHGSGGAVRNPKQLGGKGIRRDGLRYLGETRPKQGNLPEMADRRLHAEVPSPHSPRDR
jgi:hypothetical protein